MSSDPDPARNLDPDPGRRPLDPDPSSFLTISKNIVLNYLIIIRFSHQKKSIERNNVVKSKIIL